MTTSSETLMADAIDGKVLMEGYKARGVILTKNKTDLTEKIVKILIFQRFFEMFEVYYNDTPPQIYADSTDYLKMSNVLKDSHPYLELVSEAVWETLITDPTTLLSRTARCRQICDNRFNEISPLNVNISMKSKKRTSRRR